MHRDPMELRVTQVRTDDGTRRTLHLDALRDPKRQTISAFFDMVDEHDVAPPQVLDGFVFGIIMYAMRLGQDIRVHGDLSRQAIRNLYELQDAWALWNPAMYHKIDIMPDAAVGASLDTREEEAIAAYSGGVDSTFTILRHSTNRLGLAAYPLKRTVLLVHGFDVPLAKPTEFEALRVRIAPLVDELKLTLRILRTNLKELDVQRWQDSFMNELACCLHNYSHEFRHALVGSSKAYDSILLPVGSSPVTDHLLSGDTLNIVHDGAGHSRTDKVAAIAQNSTATAVVKVCWEGKETFTNCGVCEKCVRTKLNVLAVGVQNPSCFQGAPDVRQQIDGVGVTSDSMCAELRSIITYARSHGVAEPWVDALDRRVSRYKIEAAEEKNGRIRNALGMVQRGEWNRIASRLRRKFAVENPHAKPKPPGTPNTQVAREKIAAPPLE